MHVGHDGRCTRSGHVQDSVPSCGYTGLPATSGYTGPPATSGYTGPPTPGSFWPSCLSWLILADLSLLASCFSPVSTRFHLFSGFHSVSPFLGFPSRSLYSRRFAVPKSVVDVKGVLTDVKGFPGGQKLSKRLSEIPSSNAQGRLV